MKATIDGQSFELKAKKFRTGRNGFHGTGILVVGKKAYRANLLLTEMTK